MLVSKRSQAASVSVRSLTVLSSVLIPCPFLRQGLMYPSWKPRMTLAPCLCHAALEVQACTRTTQACAVLGASRGLVQAKCIFYQPRSIPSIAFLSPCFCLRDFCCPFTEVLHSCLNLTASKIPTPMWTQVHMATPRSPHWRGYLPTDCLQTMRKGLEPRPWSSGISAIV